MRYRCTQFWVCGLLLCSLIGCGGSNEGSAATAARNSAPAGAEQSAPSVVSAAPAVPTPTFVPVDRAAGGVVPQNVRIEDTAWQGSYRRSTGATTYGGRTATWIYGTGTNFSTMRAPFRAAGQPSGAAQLVIEGMDSEDRAKTAIQITINDVEIFNGPNPLPNDDQPIDSGTWSSHTFPFDAKLLKTGTNTITISTQVPGQFSRPPFFMLDYAEVRFTSQ